MDFTAAFELSNQWTGGWFIPVAAGLAISAAVVAIGWMVAEALRGSDLKGWSRKELNEFVLSCAIVAVVTFSLWAFYMISLALTNGMDPYDVAKDYFSNEQNGLFAQVMQISQTLAGKTYVYELTGDIRVNLTVLIKKLIQAAAKIISVIPLPPAKAAAVGLNILTRFLPDIVTRPFGSVDDISSGLDTLVTMSFLSTLLALAQLEALKFFQFSALQFLFPLGIVMRAFPISRKIGSTIIALALVGAVAYPLSILLSKAIYDQTAPVFGAPDLTISAPKSISVALVSPEEGDIIMLNDTIEWTVENGSSYRIWKSKSDYTCPCPDGTKEACTCVPVPVDMPLECTCECKYPTGATAPETEQQPLPEPATSPQGQPSIRTWRSNQTLFGCLQLAKSGVANSTRVKLRVFDIVGTESNSIYSFVLDAYNGTAPMGWDEAKVIVGDPCYDSGWTRMRCMMGHRYVISELSAGKTTVATLEYIGKGVFGAIFGDFFLNDLPKFLARQFTSGTMGSGLFRMASTPVLAGQMLLGLSERLPAFMFPSMMVILSVVISSFVCLSSFRSVSELIGGEVELPGLARVV